MSELARPLPINLAAGLQHVQVLEASGLVATRKQGRVRTCRLVPEALLEAARWLAQRRALWERRLDRLESLLDARSLTDAPPTNAPSADPTEEEPR